MTNRTPDDIRNSIKSLVEEAEQATVEDKKVLEDIKNESLSPQPLEKDEFDELGSQMERKSANFKKELVKETQDNDIDLAGLLSDDVALAVRAELIRYSEVFDTDDTKDIIYKAVSDSTRDMVREWLDENLPDIAKEVINEALEKLASSSK